MKIVAVIAISVSVSGCATEASTPQWRTEWLRQHGQATTMQQPPDPDFRYWNDPTFRPGAARDRIDQEYVGRFQAKCKRVGEIARSGGDWRTPLHELTNEEYNAVDNHLYWPSVLTAQESMCVDILVGAGILVRPAQQLSPAEVIMLCEPMNGYSPCAYPR